MIRVLAVRPPRSYAPEVGALRDFLSARPGFEMDVVEHRPEPADSGSYDVAYEMMGFIPRWTASSLPELHDYASVSTGRLPRLKNQLKRRLGRKPAVRSFLSPWVEREMGFADGIPSFRRDMGVPDAFLAAGRQRLARSVDAQYDLLMVGSLTASRGVPEMLELIGRNKQLSVALVGEPEPGLRAAYESERVAFLGRLDHRDIPQVAATSRAGLNWMPDQYPFRHQTSTKVLEYFSLGLPVVSNSYRWIDDFCTSRGVTYTDLHSLVRGEAPLPDAPPAGSHDFSDLSWPAVWERCDVAGHLTRAAEAGGR